MPEAPAPESPKKNFFGSLMRKVKETFTDKQKLKQLAILLLPIVALVVLYIVYVIVVKSYDYNVNKAITTIINQGTVLAIVATGAIFIYTLGSFDISLGASTLLAATLGVLTYTNTHNLALMILVMFAVGIGCSLISSTLASLFRIPVFVTTVAMMSVLGAIARQLLNTYGGGNTISIPRSVLSAINNPWVRIAFIVAWLVLCVFIFEFTKIGRRQKFLGANPICAKMTGISLNKYAIIAFTMAGISVGLGALLTLSYSPCL